jgi:Sec-independent protein secretion pathway component TatC
MPNLFALASIISPQEIKISAMVAIPLSLWLDEANLVLGDILEQCRRI